MDVVYKCTLTQSVYGVSNTYAGLTAKTFKDHYTKHKASLNDREYHLYFTFPYKAALNKFILFGFFR